MEALVLEALAAAVAVAATAAAAVVVGTVGDTTTAGVNKTDRGGADRAPVGAPAPPAPEGEVLPAASHWELY